ncbi:MAG: undecaprenyl-phosphate galactose phosphotransferase WbaP [Chloroflexi bacterium]|nr:undecaprenyl-phosphate galactose phosphotransferase WbaP [Chloroflexota bacterium]
MNWTFVDTQKKHSVELFEMRTKPLIDHRGRMFGVTLFSDLSALILAVLSVHWGLSLAALYSGSGVSEIDHVLFVMICLSLFMATNLYPGIGLNPAMEMKTVTQLTVLGFLIVFSFDMIRVPSWSIDKLMLILISGLSAPFILGMRWLTRIIAVKLGVWGEPVVVIAGRDRVSDMTNYFNYRRRLGFLPVLGVTEKAGSHASSAVQIMEVEDLLKLPHGYFFNKGIHTVLVSTQIGSELSRSKINHDLLQKFKRMIFVSDMDWLEGVSIAYHDFEGMIGMEAQQNFLAPIHIFLKRAMDILLAGMLMVLLLPVFFLTALLIRLDSPGPAIYKQERIGRNGRRIRIQKFRSMQVGADQILADYLAANPQARREWDETQKLRDDPRITRVGKWLRKLSVDEIPQLFNILVGDMSLVGPRPIVENEVKRYKDNFDVYSTVRPGITGMWQVSGRNNTTYDERVMYDVYYVRNWSVWLDVYILFRTIWVVLGRHGAY